jgi:transcription elongation GreA/GreB family factor
LKPPLIALKLRTVRRWRAATEMPPPRPPEEIRYWGARRASAEVVKTSDDKSKPSFGMTVTLRRDDGREQSFRIVGEDEADPSRGTLSHLSPLARALLTHGPGEAVAIAGHEAIILDVR